MGGCFSKAKLSVRPSLPIEPGKAETEANVTVQEVDQLIDLKKFYQAGQIRMHRRVKDCYDCIFANNYEAITDLNLKFVNLGAEGVAHLSVALPFFPKLVSLRLWKTRIGTEGASHLARALLRMPSIRLLSLEDNELGAPGLQRMSEALKSLSNLEELFIHLNHLRPEGGAVLSSIVGSLRNLRSVTSDENDIEDQAASDLIRNLSRSAASLRLIGLSFNKLTDSLGTVLLKIVKDFPQLRRVTLNGNFLSLDMREKLLSDGPQVTFNF